MIDLDPEQYGTNPITCWGLPTAEQLEAGAKAQRESLAIFRLFGPEDVYRLNQWLWAMIFAQAKEEFLRKEPWARQFIK